MLFMTLFEVARDDEAALQRDLRSAVRALVVANKFLIEHNNALRKELITRGVGFHPVTRARPGGGG